MRPQPFQGEGLRGYFLRLADANGLLPNIDLYRKAFKGIGLDGVSRQRLESVAAAFGLDLVSLCGLGCRAMVADPARCHYLGHRIAAQHLRGAQCAVCPLCLTTCAAVRADWELVAQVACPQHGCWLVDQCSRCHRPISWRRRSVRVCLCGQDLGRLKVCAADRHALDYAGALARRLFGDLEPVERAGALAAEVASAPLNQLLGMFQLFGNSRFRSLHTEPPCLPAGTSRLKRQASAVCAIGSALADWPVRWHGVLTRMAEGDRASPTSPRLIVSVQRARAPFEALHRAKWSAAAEYPRALGSELGRFMRARRVQVASRRYYMLASGQPAETARSTDLEHLWAPKRGTWEVGPNDLLSVDAVRDLFDATEVQMRALYRTGLLQEGQEWYPAREVDAAFAALTRWTDSRPRASTDEFIPLWDFGLHDAGELEVELRRVMTGETATVTWRHIRPPGLGNLFVRRSGNAPKARV